VGLRAGWLVAASLLFSRPFASRPPLEPVPASGSLAISVLREKPENMASRLDKRKEVEAAEARGGDGAAEKDGKKKRAVAGAKKKPAKKKSRSKPVERRRIVWVIYNSTQKEEDRFPYEQKKAAEERLEVLRSKSKRLYWLQAVKEAIGAPPPGTSTDIYEENYVPEVEVEEPEIEVELEEEEEEEAEEEEDEDEDE
jgi:hypothetical protein